jgi:copper chaperone CopZ
VHFILAQIFREKAVLRVEDMSCDTSVKTITKAAGELPGVKKGEVDLKGGAVSFMFDPAKTPLHFARPLLRKALIRARQNISYTTGTTGVMLASVDIFVFINYKKTLRRNL